MAFEDAAGVSVDYEDGMFAGVEKNGVGGFGADAAQREELIAQNRRWSGEHAGKGAAVECIQKVHEGLESLCFLPKITRRTEEASEPRGVRAANGLRRKHASVAQITNGAFDVGPGSVLREDGSDDNFEAGPAGPPVLRATGAEKCVEIRARNKGGRKFGRRSLGGDCSRRGKRKIGVS